MKFTAKIKNNSKEWVSKFAFFPVRLDQNGSWLWLEKYEERLANSYWLSKDGTMPIDGAAAFVFERRCEDGRVGTIKKYQSD